MSDAPSPLASVVACALLALPAQAQDRTIPTPQATYSIGDRVPEHLKVSQGYAGLDLPPLKEGRCYVRTDEFIYTIDRRTREVLDVRPIANVLIW